MGSAYETGSHPDAAKWVRDYPAGSHKQWGIESTWQRSDASWSSCQSAYTSHGLTRYTGPRQRCSLSARSKGTENQGWKKETVWVWWTISVVNSNINLIQQRKKKESGSKADFDWDHCRHSTAFSINSCLLGPIIFSGSNFYQTYLLSELELPVIHLQQHSFQCVNAKEAQNNLNFEWAQSNWFSSRNVFWMLARRAHKYTSMELRTLLILFITCAFFLLGA